MLQKAVKRELFAFAPRPYPKDKPRHGSRLGLAFTVFVLGAMIGFIVYACLRLANNERSTTVVTQTPVHRNFSMVPIQLHLPFINDKSYFTYNMQLRSSQVLNGATARRDLRADIVNNDTVAFSAFSDGTVPLLANDCSKDGCDMVRVRVNPCVNSSSTVPCQTADVINSIINNQYMLLSIFASAKDGTPQTQLVELSLKDGLSFRQRFPFDGYVVRQRANYFTTWEPVYTTTLQLSTPWFAIDRLPRLTTGPNTEYCKIDFQLSGLQIKEDHIAATSLDTLGDISAFFGAISGVIAFFMASYNEKAFYRAFPGWADVGDRILCDGAPPTAAGTSAADQLEPRDPNQSEEPHAEEDPSEPIAVAVFEPNNTTAAFVPREWDPPHPVAHDAPQQIPPPATATATTKPPTAISTGPSPTAVVTPSWESPNQRPALTAAASPTPSPSFVTRHLYARSSPMAPVPLSPSPATLLNAASYHPTHETRHHRQQQQDYPPSAIRVDVEPPQLHPTRPHR